MEETGIKIDKKYFSEFQNELEQKLSTLENEIYELANEEFNIDSPQQLGEVLFEKLQISASKKTKTGYSTNVEVLEMIANNGELTEEKTDGWEKVAGIQGLIRNCYRLTLSQFQNWRIKRTGFIQLLTKMGHLLVGFISKSEFTE